MSAHSSQESGGLTSPSMLSSALALLGSVRKTVSVDKSLLGTGPESPSSLMCEKSMLHAGQLTSSTADIPVSPSLTPEIDAEPLTQETSGLLLQEAFAYFDPVTSSLKMSQGTLLSDSTEPSLILSRWGMTQDGDVFELPTPVHHISETVSFSLLPTPQAHDARGSKSQVLLADLRAQKNGGYRNLVEEVRLLPTPTVGDSRSAGSRDHVNTAAKQGTSLTDVFRMLPTPTARDGKGRDLPTRTHGSSLPNLMLGDDMNQASEGGSESQEEGHLAQQTLWGD